MRSMKARLPYALSLVLLAGCGEATAPSAELAVARTAITYQYRDVNPCTSEPMTLTAVASFTSQTQGVQRSGVVERLTGVGDWGTSFTGGLQSSNVSHPLAETDGFWGSARFALRLRGSDGSRFSVTAVFVSDAVGELKLALEESRCL